MSRVRHTADPTADPRLVAGVELLRRTGLASFQIRYSDDEPPLVWIAVGEWKLSATGRPVPEAQSVGSAFEATAAMDPLRAIMRLCDRVIDGGQCTHCHRPSGVSDDFTQTMPLNKLVCWYQYDPELQTFRRGCEGD